MNCVLPYPAFPLGAFEKGTVANIILVGEASPGSVVFKKKRFEVLAFQGKTLFSLFISVMRLMP